MHFLRIFCILLSSLAITLPLYAQDTLQSGPLKPIVIEADRMASQLDQAPLSITKVERARIQQGQQQLNLSESLGPIPGLNSFSSQNFSQDLRLSLRGFGARSAFGIRGIRVLVDGIPESTPDGQAQVDNIDLGNLQGLEVLRGPSAHLFGNAAGGALLLQTEEPVADNLAEGRLTLGSFGFQRYQLKAGIKREKWSGLVYGAQTQVEGFREHSRFKQTYLSSRIKFQPTDNQELILLGYFANSPIALDPGGVDSAQFYAEPSTARDRNVQFGAGETVQQGRIALRYKWESENGGKVRAKAYFTNRDFANFLPFETGGRVRVNRNYGGGGLSYEKSIALNAQSSYRLHAGIDLDLQRDERQQFQNLEGVQGELTGAQLEAFSSGAVYLLNQLELGSKWLLQANARLDLLWLSATDRFLSNGDNSGQRQYQRLNPGLGASYAWHSSQYLFARFSTSFETPTLSELSAHPEGLMGFNPDLQPQQAQNLEVGIKGLIQQRIRYALTAYSIQLNGELLPFEIAGQQGRTFFRNAGQTQRRGLEAYMQASVYKGLTLTGSYAYQHFTFSEFEKEGQQLAGNVLPGIPAHSYYLETTYTSPNGLFARIWWQGRGSVFADDENSVQIPAAQTLQARLGWEISRKNLVVQPFIGFNNLLNATYPDNVRINAFGARYYEAGTPRSFFGGVMIRFSGNQNPAP